MSEPSTEISDAPVAYESKRYYKPSTKSTEFSYDLERGQRIDVIYDPEMRRFSAKHCYGNHGLVVQIGMLERGPSIITVDGLVKELEQYGPVPDNLKKTMHVLSHGKEPFPPWQEPTYRPCDTLDGYRVSPTGQSISVLKYDNTKVHGATKIQFTFDYDRGRITSYYDIGNQYSDEKSISKRSTRFGNVQELEASLPRSVKIPNDARFELERLTKEYPLQRGLEDHFKVEIHGDDRYTVQVEEGGGWDTYDITPEGRLTRPELTTFLSSYGLDQRYIDTVIEETSFDIGVSENQQFGYTGFAKSGWLPENEFAYPSDKGGHVLVYWNPHDNQFMAGLESMGGGPCEPLGTEEPVNTLDELALVVEPHGALPERFKVMVTQAKRQHAEEHKTENNLEHSSEEREISTSRGR